MRASAGRVAKAPFLGLLGLVIGPVFSDLTLMARSRRGVPHAHARGARRDTIQSKITFFVAKTRATGMKGCFFTGLRRNVIGQGGYSTVPPEIID
jgi:hypothetical protein